MRGRPPPVTDGELDRLEALHAGEERGEAQRDVLAAWRPMGPVRPAGGVLPASQRWLERLYAGERIVREKKPLVIDSLRSRGAWLVSVDEPPLSVLDGMSQTATLPGGLADDGVVDAYVRGGFGDTLLTCEDTTAVAHPALEAFADTLRDLLPSLPEVTFTNGGAEAIEKALALCRLAAPHRRRTGLLALEGSFHGRTLLALHASHNPAKRLPFQMSGHGVTYAPFPVWDAPGESQPPEPAGYLAAMAAGDVGAAVRWRGRTPLLDAELEALRVVDRVLSTDTIFAVLVEPMQSEGGDRYASARFFRALRLLTRHHGVPLVFDEVQTGFGLSGSFAWHTRFHLVDGEGRPDGPDAVAFAKRAQLGVVMSRWRDPETTSAHPASAVRGRLHAPSMRQDTFAPVLEGGVRERLGALEARFPDLVAHPRATGYACAFDLPTAEHLAAYLGQRFYRGAVVFGAGARTVRYRLSTAFGAREVDRLFDAVRGSLKWMEAHPSQSPPAWQEVPPSPRRAVRATPAGDVRVRPARPDEAEAVLQRVMALEARVYEPERRDPEAQLRLAFEDPDGVALLCEVRRPGRDGTEGEWTMAGHALGAPLEHFGHVAGPDGDPMRGRHNTLYSVALTVDPAHQGMGLGRRLKEAQLREARARRRTNGEARYRYVSGRNRVGYADVMAHLNVQYHAHVVARVKGAYGDPAAEATYYRQPLGLPAPLPSASSTEGPPSLDLTAGASRPFSTPPPSLRRAHDAGLLFGPAVHKLTLSNYVTPAVVRAVEWVGALAPEQPHLYLTSSRDECFDKAVRALKWHRPDADVVLGLEGGYVGHTTAAARSLSDPAVHAQGPGHFGRWGRLPHPEVAGVEGCVRAFRSALTRAGGAHRVLGLFVEPVQERTGRVLTHAFWEALRKVRAELDVPVVTVETASACYRSGRGAFAGTNAAFVPDAVLWWGGGQVGFVHVAERWRVAEPLTLVSTWDGDELSLVRVHHQLRAARGLDVTERSRALDEALAPVSATDMEVRGLGLHRCLDAGAWGRARRLAHGLGLRGVRAKAFPHGVVTVAPPLDVSNGALAHLRRALEEMCR